MADPLTDMFEGAQAEATDAHRTAKRWDQRPGRAPALLGALAAGLVTPLLARYSDAQWETAAVVLVVFGVCGALLGGDPRWARLLPFAGVVSRLSPALLGTVVLVIASRVSDVPALPTFACVKAGAVALVVTLLTRRLALRFLSPPPIRAALIGSQFSADSLARELLVAHDSRHVIVGRIVAGENTDEPGEVPVLGTLPELGPLVARDDIDLLLMTGDVPRLAVFDEVARSCLELPVRLHEVSSFYEETFGHVPVAEINASWFQYLMHPRYRAGKGKLSRALDITVAGGALLFAGPLIGFFALLIRRDGGPAFFRQERIGEGGRRFTLTKLRTMRENAEVAWSTADDDRVTPVGRFLRRTHLDELPQLLNILRGEMSVVGPRPEQPAFVDRLEQVVPFYTRRHLTKPGLTGWAQVRCGYAGSDLGSAWKVCHDLYYLKHRSLGLDLLILLETVRTLVADPQYTAEPSSVAFILGRQIPALEPVPSPAIR